jgi:hypothetical protein
MHRFCAILAVQLFAVVRSLHAQEAPLTRLSKEVTSPFLAFKSAALGSSNEDANLAGWLMLNGARFANSEYPDLAKALREMYERQGIHVTDSDFTQLPTEKNATDGHGRTVQGVAICPQRCARQEGNVAPGAWTEGSATLATDLIGMIRRSYEKSPSAIFRRSSI